MAKFITDVEVFGMSVETGLMDICVHYSDGSIKSMEVNQETVTAFCAVAEWESIEEVYSSFEEEYASNQQKLNEEFMNGGYLDKGYSYSDWI